MVEKLVCVIMGQNCERFIDMSLESVKDSDAIIFCDGGSTDETLNIVSEFFLGEITVPNSIIQNTYNQEDKKMNGKQRNFYLNYIKENYKGYWALCIDADEVVEDLSKIKEFIQHEPDGLWSVKMRHLIGDLGHEDSIQPIHWVLNRLFKVKCADKYPEVEHPVLQDNKDFEWYEGNTDCTTIWHLAYIPNLWEITKRYESHLLKSNMHTPEYLKSWYFAHLFGTYPKTQLNPVELPSFILDKFGVDKDELYFANRGLEVKHGIMVKQWNEFFEPNSVLALGCGRGPFLYYWNWFVGICRGIECSKWAIDNSFVDCIQRGYIQDIPCYERSGPKKKDGSCRLLAWDLITAIDVLEHLEYNNLDETIDHITLLGNKILISVPFKGTPNCENDPTHIIKEDRDWWIKQFIAKGLKEVNVPAHFLYKEQLLIFKK
jgi:glycosyltransferase involved in cell wall biosynthesis